MASAKRTSERKKGMPTIRMGTSKNSEEGPPITAEREKPIITTETPASVEEKSREGKANPLDIGCISKPSGEPRKGSPSRERSSLGLEERELFILPQEDVEKFGEFLHGGKPKAVPKVRSFEEDDMLKRLPPDFVLGPEHWIGLHEEIREKLWQAYRLVNPSTFAEAEQSTKVVEAISTAREELVEKKAREIFEEEHKRKISDFQSRLEEAARRMWTHDRILRDTEERIAGT